MNGAEIAFLIFGLIIILGTVIMILTKQVVRALIAFVTVLLSLAGVFILFNADFLAAVQILVYAGGIVILLAFGIMLSDRTAGKLVNKSSNGIIGVLIALAMGAIIITKVSGYRSIPSEASPDQVRQIGVSLVSNHLLAFELIAFILLVVLVGAGYLAKKRAEL